jgi:hypothetical protein
MAQCKETMRAWNIQRAVIEFLTAESVPSIDIHRPMKVVYGYFCAEISTVRL